MQKIEDIKFNINEELNNTLLELLLIRQILKEEQIDLKYKSKYFENCVWSVC